MKVICLEKHVSIKRLSDAKTDKNQQVLGAVGLPLNSFTVTDAW